MSILQSEITKYSFKPQSIKALIAQALGKKESEIEVKFIVTQCGDDRFGSTYPEVTSIEVSVK